MIQWCEPLKGFTVWSTWQNLFSVECSISWYDLVWYILQLGLVLLLFLCWTCGILCCLYSSYISGRTFLVISASGICPGPWSLHPDSSSWSWRAVWSPLSLQLSNCSSTHYCSEWHWGKRLERVYVLKQLKCLKSWNLPLAGVNSARRATLLSVWWRQFNSKSSEA